MKRKMSNEIGRKTDGQIVADDDKVGDWLQANRSDPVSVRDMEEEIESLTKDLEFYKSIFKNHGNSAVFNLKIKTINGVEV